MQVRLFNYREPTMLYRSTNNVERLSERCASRIIDDVENGTPTSTINIPTRFLDDRAQLHCDKWVEETASHMSKYSAAQQPGATPPVIAPSSLPSQTPSDMQRLIIHYKSFSGDVSGVIGEALFSCILKRHFLLNDWDFAHFRADKKSELYPDFGIFTTSSDLQSELNWDGKSAIQYIVPAEVKAVTSIEKGIIKPRLIKGVQQIQSFWSHLNTKGASILCMAIRNQSQCSYDVALIWGR